MSLLSRILSEAGHAEIVGANHNPEIVKYFKDIGFEVKDDETAWCSAFMNWCAMMEKLERSHNLSARSWLNIGEKVVTPQIGDIAIFWRGTPEGWQGHVAVFCNQIGNDIYVLGGNQGNSVSIAAYPKERLLGYRRLKEIHGFSPTSTEVTT